ncbi:translation factor GUF1 homolog, mitochondrial isoform X1 [Schistocerca gregaria]|uniref:translation factor GUF1 homolog, mitochondrial isoform X1 n=1 Tax=Schistocerca gregaria TaxID=7010 RepID=UPI00211E36E9|nr:translation factor GUF1 homolog, mitochondrial isoform X1 [Schistocerca gregaria]
MGFVYRSSITLCCKKLCIRFPYSVRAERKQWFRFSQKLMNVAGADSESRQNNGEMKTVAVSNIRNFSIIAHVDHGKSTLADRLLEIAGVIDPVEGQTQVLDMLQVEKERGITVKAQTVSLSYKYKDQEYLLNLIDTPGHVDFSNEVSRSLAACQGVILLVDANQGVQAQTVANFYLAFCRELTIIPVMNKVDLKNANPDAVTEQLKTLFGINEKDVLRVSAKFGTGVKDLIHAVIERVPPPKVDRNAPFRALIYDSWYDRYRGTIILMYIRDGSLKIGDEIQSVHTKKVYTVKSLGLLRPQEEQVPVLAAGQVGFITCNMRSTKEAHIGDTFHLKDMTVEPIEGFKRAQPMVFAGVYPMDQSQHVALRGAIEKLVLNDPAVSVSVDSSPALGQGWRLGFLGLLHLEVFSQRLEQEYGAQAVLTAPSVTYKARIIGEKNIKHYGGEEILFSNPSHFPPTSIIAELQEPTVMGTIITPDTFIGSVISLCMERRGIQKTATNIDNNRVMMQFILPLNEIIVDFHDELKSVSSGYASFDYEDHGYVPSQLVKLTIMLNGVAVDELSTIVHISKAVSCGRKMCEKLKEIIPRQMIQIAIQACVGGKIVARETLKPYRKDVTAKLYGGDVTRRMKLLRRQAEGKKKMKMVANIGLPRETFIDVLKR